MTLLGPIVEENSGRVDFLELPGRRVYLSTRLVQCQRVPDVSVCAHRTMHLRTHARHRRGVIAALKPTRLSYTCSRLSVAFRTRRRLSLSGRACCSRER